MAYDEALAQRLRSFLEIIPGIEEKAAFQRLAFMLHDKMLLRLCEDELICRFDPSLHEELVASGFKTKKASGTGSGWQWRLIKRRSPQRKRSRSSFIQTRTHESNRT